MVLILDLGFSCSPKLLYVSLDPLHLLSLMQLQTGLADMMILMVWVYSPRSRFGRMWATLWGHGLEPGCVLFWGTGSTGKPLLQTSVYYNGPTQRVPVLFWTHEVFFSLHGAVSKMATFLRFTEKAKCKQDATPIDAWAQQASVAARTLYL